MNTQQLTHLFKIREASEDGKLVTFVGAGVSANSGVPTWHTLIEEFKSELDLNYECDDLKLAQLYRDARGHKEYMDKVKDVLKHNRVMPNVIHKDILDLNPCHIITTNYDNLIEQEVQNEFRQFTVIREDKDLPNMKYQNTLVKMHGDYETNNIVLCEKDYYDYAKNFPLIRSFVLSLFASKVVVFIGFSFDDLNLKIILNELQGVLQDNMQRVYLISDREPDRITSQYYQNKGINVVYLKENEIDIILKNHKDKSSTQTLKGKGRYLHKLLTCIKYVRKNLDTDELSNLYARITSVEDELNIIGEGIEHFMRNSSTFRYITFGSDCFYVNKEYLIPIIESLTSFSCIKEFIKKHNDVDLRKLKKIAYRNRFFYINGIKIIGDDYISQIQKKEPKDSNLMFYMMDTKRLKERLRSLSSMEISCKSSDLEYPYLLCKLGDYDAAYEQYEKILSNAWNTGKYIVYFICLYNIYSIRYLVKNQLCLEGSKDYSKIIERANKIDLNNVLHNLPIPTYVRKMFEDILYNKVTGRRTIDSANVKEELYGQRIMCEKGGSSINNNIYKIYSLYEKELSFYDKNHIVCYNDEDFENLCCNVVAGILNSYATPSTKFDGLDLSSTKIEKIDKEAILMMVYFVPKKKLEEIFKQYNIEKIEVKDNVVEMINIMLSNMIEFESMRRYQIISNRYIINLFFLISKLEKANINQDILYNDIIYFYKQSNAFWDYDVLYDNLLKYLPTANIAKDLLDVIIRGKHTHYYFDHIVHKLVEIMNNAHMTYIRNDFDEIFDKQNATFNYDIFKIISDNDKAHYNETIQENIVDLYNFLYFIIDNELMILSESKLKDLIEKYNFVYNGYRSAHCCHYLKQIYNDSKVYGDFRNIIEETENKQKVLKFIMNPLQYDDYRNVDTDWLLLVLSYNENLFKELITNDVYKQKIKDYIKNTNDNKEYTKYLIDLL